MSNKKKFKQLLKKLKYIILYNLAEKKQTHLLTSTGSRENNFFVCKLIFLLSFKYQRNWNKWTKLIYFSITEANQFFKC